MKLLLVALAAAFALPVGSSSIVHCSDSVVPLGAGPVVVGYLTFDEGGGLGTAPPRPVLYLETNGESGLQHGGSSLLLTPSPCEQPNPDLRVVM